MSFIRSSKHKFDKSNKRKLSFINQILLDFRNMCKDLIDYLWTNPYNLDNYYFNISKNKLDIPVFLSTTLCGLVRKANRKNQAFKCLGCGYTADSDENACSNLLLDLPEISSWVRLGKYNISGFYWKPEGLYDLKSGVLVPDTKKE